MKKIIFLISIILISISSTNILIWNEDKNTIDKEAVQLNNIENEIEENDNIKINNMFDELKKINKDFIGWIELSNTKINYPLVQYKDNKHYLNHTYYNKKNDAGWIFLDYRNNNNFDDENTIIYGHNRFDGSMFGSLKNVIAKKDNYIISIDTKYYTILYKVFSVYKIKTTSDYLITNFKNKADYKLFINLLIKRSKYDYKIDVSADDKILTLSTCSGSSHKLVVHAKKIRLQYK